MASRIVLAWFLSSASLAPAIVCAQTASFEFTQKPGTYGVGLKVVDQYDHSRVFPQAADDPGKPQESGHGRPLQTLVWYPALPDDTRPMTVGDYVDLAITETRFGPSAADSVKPERYTRWSTSMAASLGKAMWARQGAAEAKGRFPVVIYAPSDSATSWENADLCEYLASHGYVVIAGPSMGANTRDMTDDVAGINEQARDISFLLDYAQTLPDTDMSGVAVAAWSWGGIAGLFAAARDHRIDALVALDGSMRYFPGLVQQAGDVHPARMTIPLLFFTQGDISIEDYNARYLSSPDMIGPNVLNAWTHGDLLTVHMLAMPHGEFGSMNQRKTVWKYFAEDQKADYAREDGIPGYAWVARYSLAFLDAYLKHQPASLAYLKKTPAENGAPGHFMTSVWRAASTDTQTEGVPPK